MCGSQGKTSIWLLLYGNNSINTTQKKNILGEINLQEAPPLHFPVFPSLNLAPYGRALISPQRRKKRKGLQIIYNSFNPMFHDWDIKIEQYTQFKFC